MMQMKSPMIYFGGKSKIAPLVWKMFGNVPNYVEPFAGSLAVLLNRPHEPGIETVNDIDGYITNVWRSLKLRPDETAEYADWPVSELDLHARHAWLVNQKEAIERMRSDPEFCDPKIAGYWLWGNAAWIGGGWCKSAYTKRPHLGDAGRGVNRQRPHLGDAGQGVNRQLPHLGDAGRGEQIRQYFNQLSDRLRNVRICCGDWTRVLGSTPTTKQGTTAIFLDPPYQHEGRNTNVYNHDSATIFDEVWAWCEKNGGNKDMRIVLCGYNDGREPIDGWNVVEWKATGGYGSRANKEGRANAKRERIWASPYCLKLESLPFEAQPESEEVA